VTLLLAVSVSVYDFNMQCLLLTYYSYVEILITWREFKQYEMAIRYLQGKYTVTVYNS